MKNKTTLDEIGELMDVEEDEPEDCETMDDYLHSYGGRGNI